MLPSHSLNRPLFSASWCKTQLGTTNQQSSKGQLKSWDICVYGSSLLAVQLGWFCKQKWPVKMATHYQFLRPNELQKLSRTGQQNKITVKWFDYISKRDWPKTATTPQIPKNAIRKCSQQSKAQLFYSGDSFGQKSPSSLREDIIPNPTHPHATPNPRQ